MHFQFCKGTQDSKFPPFCTAFERGSTNINNRATANLFPVLVYTRIASRRFQGDAITTSLLYSSDSGKGFRDRRTENGLARCRQDQFGPGAHLNATSSSPRPLALVPPVFRKTMPWQNGGPPPPSSPVNILCYNMEVAELLREISRASCSTHGAV